MAGKTNHWLRHGSHLLWPPCRSFSLQACLQRVPRHIDATCSWMGPWWMVWQSRWTTAHSFRSKSIIGHHRRARTNRSTPQPSPTFSPLRDRQLRWRLRRMMISVPVNHQPKPGPMSTLEQFISSDLQTTEAGQHRFMHWFPHIRAHGGLRYLLLGLLWDTHHGNIEMSTHPSMMISLSRMMWTTKWWSYRKIFIHRITLWHWPRLFGNGLHFSGPQLCRLGRLLDTSLLLLSCSLGADLLKNIVWSPTMGINGRLCFVNMLTMVTTSESILELYLSLASLTIWRPFSTERTSYIHGSTLMPLLRQGCQELVTKHHLFCLAPFLHRGRAVQQIGIGSQWLGLCLLVPSVSFVASALRSRTSLCNHGVSKVADTDKHTADLYIITELGLLQWHSFFCRSKRLNPRLSRHGRGLEWWKKASNNTPRNQTLFPQIRMLARAHYKSAGRGMTLISYLLLAILQWKWNGHPFPVCLPNMVGSSALIWIWIVVSLWPGIGIRLDASQPPAKYPRCGVRSQHLLEPCWRSMLDPRSGFHQELHLVRTRQMPQRKTLAYLRSKYSETTRPMDQ